VYEHRRRHRWANSLFVTGLPDNGRGVIRWWVTRDCALVEDQQKRSCRTARPAVTNPRISVWPAPVAYPHARQLVNLIHQGEAAPQKPSGRRFALPPW